jgi:hypothetical protein
MRDKGADAYGGGRSGGKYSARDVRAMVEVIYSPRLDQAVDLS